MANPILGIGISGISTAQAGLLTAGHNISNVNTPGYSRQEVVQTPNIAQYSGAGYIGRGVNVAAIQRAYDSLLQAQSWHAEASLGHEQAMLDQIGRIDQLLADPAGGLSPAIDAFFRGVQDVAGNPADSAARQGLLAQAQSLASRFRQIDEQFNALRTDVSSRLASAVGLANSITSQIAQLNDRIALASARGSGTQLPNDLLDRRDALVGDLAKQIRTVVVAQDDGSYSIFLGNGQPLVLGTTANRLVLMPGAEDPRQMRMALQNKASTLIFRTDDLAGGLVGGILEFRDRVLDTSQNALGRLANSLAAAVNEQQELGQDRSGAFGGSMFDVGAPQVLGNSGNAGGASLAAVVSDYGALTTSDYRLRYDGAAFTLTRLVDGSLSMFASLPNTVDGVELSLLSGAPAAGDSFLIQPTRRGAGSFAVKLADPNRIAAAAPIRTSASLGNSGNAAISAGAVNAPPPPDPNLSQTVMLTFTSPTTFDVSGTGTGNPTGVTYLSGGSISYNGWTVDISGIPATGDRFIVSSNTGGTGDNRNALALAALQTGKLMSGGSDTLQGAYAELVSAVGNRTQEARVGQAAQSGLLSEVERARSSATGVNLDQEAASLLRYQQAYQAAGKVIAIAGQLFNTILDLG